MVDFAQVEQVLKQSFEDYVLSTEEKAEIQQALQNYSRVDQLNFARNIAFKLVRKAIENNHATYYRALKWLEQVIKTVDGLRQSADGKRVTEALFSPGNRIVNRIKALLKTAKDSIDVCVFTISDDRLTEALLAAYHRGVLLRIITDNHKLHDLGSDINQLAKAGIPVRTDKHDSHMHHKFAIIDQSILINGSFNWTRSASKENQENIVVDSQSQLVEVFSRQFEKLWLQSRQLHVRS